MMLLAAPASVGAGVDSSKLTNGGRNDVSVDGEWIFFDRVVSTEPYEMEIFRIRKDGRHEECLTCGLDLPAIIGQPTTHPSGKGIVFAGLTHTAPFKKKSPYYHPSWGFHNDFYWLDLLNRKAHMVLDCSQELGNAFGSACLHPQFSPDGKKLLFASRKRSGRLMQNPWQWWAPMVGDFDESGVSGLNEILTREENKFFETHQIKDNGMIYYSFGPGSYPQGVYSLHNGDLRSVYAPGNGEWIEHLHEQPDGSKLVCSSHKKWAPRDGIKNLRLELHEIKDDGTLKKLTDFGKVVSDYSCFKDLYCVVQVADLGDAGLQPELYILTW